MDITANASAVTALTTRVTTAEGTITTQSGLITNLQSELDDSQLDITANASATDSLTTRVTTAEGNITSTATSLSSLTTTVGTNTSSISTQQTSINGIEANYSVKIDINGRVTGFGLTSTASTATPTSAFTVIADSFSVVDPASTASAPIIPFTVSAGLITLGTNVRISGDLVTTGTINATRLNIDGVTMSVSGNSLIIKSGGVDTTQVAANAVSKFSSTTAIGTGPVSIGTEYVILTDTITTNGGEVIAWADIAIERFVTGRTGVLRLYIGGTIVAQRSLLASRDQVVAMGRRTGLAAGTYTVKFVVLLTAGSMGTIDDGTLIALESKR